MAFRSTADRYGTLALSLHWLTVLVILVMIATGVATGRVEDEAMRLQLLRAHALWGAVVLALTTVRLLWRLMDRTPALPADVPWLQRRAARATHAGLYILMLLLVVSGTGTLLISGAFDTVVGRATTPLPADFFAFPPRVAHRVAAWTFLALAAVHVLAALHHHWIRRDDVLRRMLPLVRRGTGASGSA